ATSRCAPVATAEMQADTSGPKSSVISAPIHLHPEVERDRDGPLRVTGVRLDDRRRALPHREPDLGRDLVALGLLARDLPGAAEVEDLDHAAAAVVVDGIKPEPHGVADGERERGQSLSHTRGKVRRGYGDRSRKRK